MAEHPNVLLNLSNRSENVMLVREMLTGVGETGDLDSSDLYDIRTAVTEACNNVVLHAYEGAEGPLQVELLASRDTIEVTVRDEGVGIRPRIRPADEAALASACLSSRHSCTASSSVSAVAVGPQCGWNSALCPAGRLSPPARTTTRQS